jgi:iron complex outermembrane receptor protein
MVGHKNVGIIFGAILALAGGHVYAADEDNGPGLNRLLPELITTARRGEESVLDVPLSIMTLSAEELQAAQIVNLSDVANATPGFSFQNYFGENLSVPTIRGVSQVDIFGDPNAPVYVDGIYISSAINFGFLDFERIEILRGPQPAFFGYNAFSGAVNFVTAKPGDELEFKGEIAVGSDDKRLVSVSVSGPLVGNRLSGRVSAMFDDFSSTYNNSNPNTNQDIGGHEYKIFSGSLFFTPTDNFDAHLNVYVSDDQIDPPAMNQIPANCEPELDPPTDPLSANPNRLLNFCGAIPTVSENGLATTVGETGEVREILRTSLNMDWDIGVGTISSLTGYSENKGEILASTDRGVAGTVFAYRSTTPGFIPGSFVLGTFEAPAIQGSAGESKAEDFSQEFRFSSPQDNRFRYTVGAYLRSTETTSPIIEGFGAWAGADSLPADINLLFGFFPDLCPCIEFIPSAGIGVSAGFGGFIFSDIFSAAAPGLDYINQSETDLWAGFFSTEYDIRDNLSAGFQGRYTDYEETFIDGNSPPASAVERYKDDFFNWRADLTFSPNELTIIYGSIAKGVKQGGIESFTSETVNPDPDCPGPQCVDNVTQNREFGQEDILTYELGYKSVFNDGNLIVEGAVFYSDWKDIVLPQIIEMVDGKAITPEGVSGNIGDGSIAGVELQVTNQFSQAFRGGLGVSYNRARFDKGEIESFTAFPSFAPRGNAAGQTLSRQPEFQSNANATYRTQFRGGWDIYARGDVNYQSRWFVGLPNQARIPGRYRTNARVGVESDRYTVELWVNNLFDDDTVEAAFRDVYLTNALPDGTNNFSTLFPWRLTVSHPQRRTYGLTMRGRF